MIKHLKDGLILRSLASGTPEDKANLPQFYIDVFCEAYGEEDKVLGPWAEALLADNHPAVTDDDVWVVVDPAQDEQIVSATLLIPQIWRYENLEIGVGRVELVATHKDYRRRGLVRELFNAAHERSAALGHQMQAVTGIPHFYRQFGYAMAVELGRGGVVPLYAFEQPEQKEKEQDKQKPFTVKPATEADIPHLMTWEWEFSRGMLLSVNRPEAYWRYQLNGRPRGTIAANDYLIIHAPDGDAVGYVAIQQQIYKHNISVLEYVVAEGISYLESFDDVIRAIVAYAKEHLCKAEDLPLKSIGFDTGLHSVLHPLLSQTNHAVSRPSQYAWYLRVTDMAGLIMLLKPVLEARLRNSLASGYTGELKLVFHNKSGLIIIFKGGGIISATNEEPALEKEDASLPFHTLLNVIFGHRSIEEMHYILPDVFANRKGMVLLQALFPVKPSFMRPLA